VDVRDISQYGKQASRVMEIRGEDKFVKKKKEFQSD
jgi:hypothetical protein